MSQGFKILRELGGVAQSPEFAVKHNAASVEGRSRTFEKQATIAAREKMNREKEVRFACDPAPIRSEAATRHDAVNMGMMGKGLSHVCRIAIMPDSAPRCFGSAAMTRIVSAAALNRMS